MGNACEGKMAHASHPNSTFGMLCLNAAQRQPLGERLTPAGSQYGSVWCLHCSNKILHMALIDTPSHYYLHIPKVQEGTKEDWLKGLLSG